MSVGDNKDDNLLYSVIRPALHEIFEQLHGDVFGDYYDKSFNNECADINRTGKWLKGFCNMYIDSLVNFYSKVIEESVRLEVKVDNEYAKAVEDLL